MSGRPLDNGNTGQAPPGVPQMLASRERWLSGLGGAALGGAAIAAYALGRRWRAAGIGAAGLVGGAFLLYRGANGPGALERMMRGTILRVEDRILVERSVPELYAYCRDVENLTRILPGLQLYPSGYGSLEGERRCSSGRREPIAIALIGDRSDCALVWRVTAGSAVMTARLELEAVQSRATEVRGAVEYAIPPGLRRLTAPVERAAMTGWLGATLHRLKQVLEVGEVATTDGQSAGVRSRRSRLLRRLYSSKATS